MIHSFSCENFYSFGEKSSLNFKVSNITPKGNGYFETPLGNKLSKVEAVIGANASGKTNLLKVLPFFRWIIIESFNRSPESKIPIHTFLGSDTNKSANLSVVFEINEGIYIHSLTVNKERILKESLKVTSFKKKKYSTKTLFSRKWDKQKNNYILKDPSFDLPEGVENSQRTNASLLSTAIRLNHKESQHIAKYWEQIETNVVEAGWLGDPSTPNKLPQWFEALLFYSNNEKLKEAAEKLLSQFDLGLNQILFDKEKSDNEITIKNIQAVHLFGAKEHKLPIIYESSGTKQLFVILKIILNALATGSIAIVDEFDVNLHPEIVIELYNLFIHPETNPKNAQLLISTHSHLLLSIIDKYQITLVEKNEKGSSESWRLDTMTGVRSDENYYAKYIAGTYGAIPNI